MIGGQPIVPTRPNSQPATLPMRAPYAPPSPNLTRVSHNPEARAVARRSRSEAARRRTRALSLAAAPALRRARGLGGGGGMHHLLAGLKPQLSPSPSREGGAVFLGVRRIASGFSSVLGRSRAGLLPARWGAMGKRSAQRGMLASERPARCLAQFRKAESPSDPRARLCVSQQA